MAIPRTFGPLLAVLLLAAGCATQPKVQPVRVFFPPAPDEPRIQFLTSFGSERDLEGQSRFSRFVLGTDNLIHRPIWKPYGVATRPGKIYVCDTQGANVAVVDIAKRRLRYIKPQGEAALLVPINVAADDDGTLYVTDTKRGQVLTFTETGGYLGAMGKTDEMKPCGVAISGDRLYVSDLKNSCVRVYAKATRELLFTIPRDPKDEKARLFSPTNIAIGPEGRLYVSDSGGFTLQVYDAEGNHLRGLGEQGVEPGRFVRPKGIGVDHNGLTYIVDAATTVVQLFDNEGRLLMYFGEPKNSGPASLYLPAGLAIDYDNVDLYKKYVAPGYNLDYLILVINQAGLQKVNIYGFLSKL